LNSSTPFVSIIIPVSRDETVLRRCLASLETLSYHNFEVLLIAQKEVLTSNSKLTTKSIVTDQASPSIKRNIAVKAAEGEILAFIDDDVQVQADWLSKIVDLLSTNGQLIVGGPNIELRKEYPYRIASAIQQNPLTEGLISHRKLSTEYQVVGIHDLPLCNLALTKQAFNHIGGFNEEISYYLDDVEFLYIAKHLGYRLESHKALAVQHDIRPAMIAYLKYKLKSRYEIGRVFPLYHCCYADALQIKLVFLSYIFIPISYLLFPASLFFLLFALYYIVVFLSTLKKKETLSDLLVIPLGVVLTHLAMYLGFTAGLLAGIYHFPKESSLKAQREKRFSFFNK
jgi:GT2 family glycosyltransferase